MLQHLRDRQRSHRASLSVSYLDASVIKCDAVLHVLLNHVPRARLGFVKRVFQAGKIRPFLVADQACLVAKIDEESGHVSVLCERP